MARKTYPSDVTNDEWWVLAPHIPPAKPGGRPRETDMRAVVNAIRYVHLSYNGHGIQAVNPRTPEGGGRPPGGWPWRRSRAGGVTR